MSSLFKERVRRSPEEIKARQLERYAPYGLLKNPFPLGGNFPEGYLDYTYLQNKDQEKIDTFLISTFEYQEFQGVLILGEYGMGKSHLLNYIHEAVNKDTQGIFEGRALAFIIENPGLAPEAILLSLMRKIKLGTIQDLVFLPVREELKKEYGEKLPTFFEKFTKFKNSPLQMSALENAPNLPWYDSLFSIGYREFRQLLEEKNIELKSKEMKQFAQNILAREITDNPIIVDSLISLMFQDESKDASSWESFLIGSLIGRKGQAVGVEFYLEALLKLFHRIGIDHIYLLVDEFEDLRTQRLNQKAAVEYLATLRRIIQHNYRLFSFVLASTRDAWGDLKLWYSAIEDRFPVVIDLARGPGQIKPIIGEYLKVARNDKYSEKDPWFPFTEAAIDRLIEIQGPVLRHVLTQCRSLIDIAATRKRITPPITPEFVEENL